MEAAGNGGPLGRHSKEPAGLRTLTLPMHTAGGHVGQPWDKPRVAGGQLAGKAFLRAMLPGLALLEHSPRSRFDALRGGEG